MSEARVIERTHNQPDLATVLREDNAALVARKDELLAAFERVPADVDSDEICGKVNDFIKQVDAAKKHAEKLRVDQKEPHLNAGRIVDGFYKTVTDPLDKVKKALTQRVTVYLRKKEDEERRRRQEEERRAHEAAEKARIEAEERAAALAKEEDLDGAIEAEEAAKRAADEAAKAAKEAEAKAAELSRTRGEFGSVGSLRTAWVHDEKSLSRASLDLEALRSHLPEDALHKAIRSYIRAGGRSLAGVRIFEDRVAVVR